MKINRKDIASGSIYCIIGVIYLVYALNTLAVGDAFNLGPGYFPIVLSGIIILLGLIVVARSFIVEGLTPFGRVPWRAIIMISLSLVVFALFVRPLGLGVTTLLAVMLACGATPTASLKTAAATGAVLAICCWLVFNIGIGLPLPFFGQWFQGTMLPAVEQFVRSGVLMLLPVPKSVFNLLTGKGA